jgi:hypothetical protein
MKSHISGVFVEKRKAYHKANTKKAGGKKTKNKIFYFNNHIDAQRI